MPDSAPRKPLPQLAVVVALVGVKLARLAPTGASAGPDGRNVLHEWDQGLAVVDIGTGDSDGQGQTTPFGDQMDLRPWLVGFHALCRMRSWELKRQLQAVERSGAAAVLVLGQQFNGSEYQAAHPLGVLREHTED